MEVNLHTHASASGRSPSESRKSFTTESRRLHLNLSLFIPARSSLATVPSLRMTAQLDALGSPGGRARSQRNQPSRAYPPTAMIPQGNA